MRALPTAIFLCAAAAAQNVPQFTWEGEVDGIAILHLRGNRVDLEYRQGEPVVRQAFRFRAPLPDLNQAVRVDVREGRGSVRVLAHPRLDNGYTASIAIEDRQDGASFYSIAVYWDRASPPSGRMDRVVWSGTVDGDVVVSCRANRCETEGGRLTMRVKSKFTRPLPEDAVPVTLDETSGSADIRLIEQPSPSNHYTARVQVRAMPGGGECSFTLSWPRPARR